MEIIKLIFSYTRGIGGSDSVFDYSVTERHIIITKNERTYSFKSDEKTAEMMEAFIEKHEAEFTEGFTSIRSIGKLDYSDVCVICKDRSGIIAVNEEIAAFIDEIFRIETDPASELKQNSHIRVDVPDIRTDTAMSFMGMGMMDMGMMQNPVQTTATTNGGVEAWDCECGCKNNTGKFCPNCGSIYNRW